MHVTSRLEDTIIAIYCDSDMRKFWISENRPVDHIGVLQTPINVNVIFFNAEVFISVMYTKHQF